MTKVIDLLFEKYRRPDLLPIKSAETATREQVTQRIGAILRAVKHGGLSVPAGTEELVKICSDCEDGAIEVAKMAILHVAKEIDTRRNKV